MTHRNAGRFGSALVSACLAFSAAACSKPDTGAPSGAPAAQAPASSATVHAPSVAATPDAAGPSSQAKAMASAQRYFRALAEGRAATRAKKYDAAVEAFERARRERPNDQRASSEEGYAYFLSGKEEYARALFQYAVDGSDKGIAAQAWYNLGLMAERSGSAREAASDFAISNALHPTKAAASRMKPGSCLATVAPAPATAAVPGWLALWDLLKAKAAGHGGEVRERPADEKAAREALTREGLPKATGGSVDAQLVGWNDDVRLVFRASSGLVVSEPVGRFVQGRCGPLEELTLGVADGLVKVTFGEDETVDGQTCFCSLPDGGMSDDVGECDPGSAHCELTCGSYNPSDIVQGYFRVADGKALANVTAKRPEDQALQVTFDATSVHLRAPGCDDTAPLP